MEYIFLIILIWLIGGFASLASHTRKEMEFENSSVLREVANPSHIVIFEWVGEWCFIKHVKPGFTTSESAVLSKNAKVMWSEFIQSGTYVYIK